MYIFHGQAKVKQTSKAANWAAATADPDPSVNLLHKALNRFQIHRCRVSQVPVIRETVGHRVPASWGRATDAAGS